MVSFCDPSLYSVVLDFNHRIERRQVRLTPMRNGGIQLKLKKKTDALSSSFSHAGGHAHVHGMTTSSSSSHGGGGSGINFTLKKKTTTISHDPRTSSRETDSHRTSSTTASSFSSSSSSSSRLMTGAPHVSHSHVERNPNRTSAASNEQGTLDSLLNPRDLARYIEELAKSMTK